MGTRSSLGRYVAFALLLTAATLGAAGCGKPKVRADQVVGKWRMADSKSNEVVLDLGPDGTGTSRELRPPHEQTIRWSLEGSDLVTASMDGSVTVRYGVKQEEPDHLLLTTKTGQLALVRAK